MVSTRTLFPVFSQARVGGFADLLIPSPWDFADKSPYKPDEDREWEAKENGLYWRGTGSDGFAAHGAWAGFCAPDSCTRRTSSNIDKSSRRRATCLSTFSRWSTTVSSNNSSLHAAPTLDAIPTKLPSALPFEENWRFRHLMDMDGAGFSGRFRSFLQSRSLPYRAALFHAWYDERVFSWVDYVPVDVRLGDGFWGVLKYLAGVLDQDNEIGDKAGAGQGPRTARKIAEQGRDWASKALRKEDMQVYLFRLLLEWGRVVSDDRETMMYDDAETTRP
ncbi:hypothetical protein ACCO45_002231 [Purpureocillium lilacinum]|uniref:Uncharacterized protein n=1 Tax=Purpureocillium lilacinum TaxID=33203 RepID=A0ACC4E9H1_PURLI